MPLTLRPNSKWWYGKYRLANGKFSVKNLNVQVQGIRPPNLRTAGDELFEFSRDLAQAEHDKVLKTLEDKRTGIRYAKNLLELTTAKKHVSPAIKDMADTWMGDHNIRQIQDGTSTQYKGASKSHVVHCRGALNRFSNFMAKHNPSVKTMASVTGEQVESFLDTIDAESLSSRTWNYYLVLLREMFNRHEGDSSACEFLRRTEERDVDTKHRKPYAESDLMAIYRAAKGDDFIRPLIVLGINTPLRLGDCCKLLWRDVDLPGGFLTIKRTSKTKEGVTIPIWDQLQRELAKQPHNEDYVFPHLAEMYDKNPTGINSRLKAVFAKAKIKFYDSDVPARKLDKRQKTVFQDDQDQVSAGEQNKNKQTAKGPRRVNGSAYQAFRVTWVTRALLRGVPEQVVIRATGHTTVQMVREHYFQPAREDMRAQLAPAQPNLTKKRPKSPQQEMRDILKKMSAPSWKKDRDRLSTLLEQVFPAVRVP